mmetsp:Transcript_24957/g.59313  ORF Transcript_24957/g.59313 Transcript_24957/m.59313 type:complete len:88 (+) Transcript_24957:2553-2816(+)
MCNGRASNAFRIVRLVVVHIVEALLRAGMSCTSICPSAAKSSILLLTKIVSLKYKIDVAWADGHVGTYDRSYNLDVQKCGWKQVQRM